MRILIIEDDKNSGSGIKQLLELNNYVVDLVLNCEDFRYKIDYEDYDLIILDWLLPDCNGADLCSELRKANNQTPILMLTAKNNLEDEITILEIGADDYLSKPFVSEGFLTRVKALIRRKSGLSLPPIILIDDLEINTNKNEVKRNDKFISLSPKEYSLLEYLAFNKSRVINRMELLSHVWGEQIDSFSNTIDVHIRYLRRKIDDDSNKKLIKTVKNKGYMLSESTN